MAGAAGSALASLNHFGKSFTLCRRWLTLGKPVTPVLARPQGDKASGNMENKNHGKYKWFLHLLLDGCVGCFYLSATMNNAAGNTGVQSIQVPLFIFGVFRSGIFVAVIVCSFSFQEK